VSSAESAPDSIAALIAQLARVADAEPQRPALTAYKGRAVTGRLTYRELLHRVAAATHQLSSTLTFGVHRGDRLAVLSTNSLEVPVLYLAAMRLGAALVPLNPASPPEDWRYVIEHAGVRLLVAEGAQPPSVGVPVCRVEDVAAPGTPPSFEPALVPGDDLAVILYTSGTTGNPKGVGLTQRNVLANGASMARRFGLSGTTQMAVLPLYHAHAFGFGLMSALCTGGHLVLAERFDPFAWPEVIRRERVEVTSVVPTLLPPLLETRVRAAALPTLRHMLVSSAPLSPSLASAFEGETGIRLVQGWGLSEYTNFACCLDPNLPDEERRALLTGEQTSVGGALPDTEVKVVGPEGKTLGELERGELCVRGPSRMLGYFRDPPATAAAIDADGWLRTGDEGYFRRHRGEPMYFITGRIKEIIIRGGEKLSPLAIERKIFATLPELEGRLVVLGFPHDSHGEEVGAYVEGSLDEVTRAGLLAALDALPPDMRPKVVLVGAESIPRTHTGKIQRRKLQPLFAQHRSHRGAVQIVNR
jgi:long-chain acyl-CoA synthetase